MTDINKALNLVIPISKPQGKLYAYSIPIEEETFEQYYLILGRVFAGIYDQGLSRTGVPICYLMLRDVARNMGIWDSRDGRIGVEEGLLGEMERLTTIYVPKGEKAFDPVSLGEAHEKGILDKAEYREVRNALIFFTVLYTMHLRDEREAILKSVCGIWGAQITSSTFTELVPSLRTSTKEDSSGEKDWEKKELPVPEAPSTSSVVA